MLFFFTGVYKASEARLMLLMYQVNYVNQGSQLKDSAISPAKIMDDSWTMDGFVSKLVNQTILLIKKMKIKDKYIQCEKTF